MNKTDLDKLRALLEKQLATLQTDAAEKLETVSSSPLADVNDQATLESERNFEIRIKSRERKLIAKVREALERIDEGTYGDCESCGDAIAIRRLEARPVTTYCINCKSEMEAEEKKREEAAARLSRERSSTSAP